MAREEWLQTLPKGIKCAEVGVQRGVFSQRIVDIVQPKELYLIDCWKAQDVQEGDVKPYLDAHYQKLQLYIAVQRFAREIKSGVVRPLVKESLEAVELFEDGYLDFVYIDALHNEEPCYQDISAWAPKVKSGGIVAGHDYHSIGGWGPCGVPAAVDRYALENSLQVMFVDDRPYRVHHKVWASKTWWFAKP